MLCLAARSASACTSFLPATTPVGLLETAFGTDYWIRPQGPVIRGEYSEPEPDLSVVRGAPDDFEDHPSTVLLVVEVSKTSLSLDTKKKQSLYASMGVPDYWVLDLENRQLLVFRQPISDENADLGHRYEQVETIAAAGHVSPLEKPDARLAVADMLPIRQDSGPLTSNPLPKLGK